MSRTIRIVASALAALWLLMGAALAQEAVPESGIDYQNWATFAQRIEEAVEAGRASDTVLKNLRSELSDWRSQFAEARDANSRTITTVQAQLDALGPVPENGQEPLEIKDQRAALEARLAELAAPGRRAQVAQSRADVLISEIDQILATRQANELLERGPTPLNPASWGRSWSAFASSVLNTRGEVLTGLNNVNQFQAFKSALPTVLVLLTISLVLLLLGWRWIGVVSRIFVKRLNTSRGWLMAFFFTLVQLFVALIGLLGLGFAAQQTQLIGLRLDPLIEAAVEGGFYLLLSVWLARLVFGAEAPVLRQFALSPRQHARARWAIVGIGLIFALSNVIAQLASFDNWSDTVRAVIFFPLIAAGGYCIWLLGRLLRAHSINASNELEEDELPRYSDGMYGILGRVLSVVGIVGPLLAAIGYSNAAMLTIEPPLKTLILLAFVMLAQRVFAEIWVFLRSDELVRDGLVPTLLGFILLLLSVPELLRIWGVSDARIDSFWTQAREGFTVGDTRITFGAFVTFAIVFVLGYTLTRLIQGALKNTVLPKTRMDQGGQNALVSGIGYVGIFLAALIAITSAGIDLSSLAIVAGALSVGIGFGLQNIVSNFVSGIILLIERPISEGDWIEVGGTHGTVRDISVRSTRIETFDRSDVILPNADFISGKVTNYTRGNTVGRVIVPVGVAYGNDTRKIEQILLEVARAHPMVLLKPEPYVVFQGFGADSLDFEIRAILRDVNFVLSVRSDMNHEIARRFKEEGVEIPFAQRDIWIRNPDALVSAGSAQSGGNTEKTYEAQPNKASASHNVDDDFDAPDDADAGDGDGDAR